MVLSILKLLIANVLTIADNSTTCSHSIKLTKDHGAVHATKYYFSNRVFDVWNSSSNDVVFAPSGQLSNGTCCILSFLFNT